MYACSVNWDLIYKFFQTSITVGVAVVIYILWHNQKAKEVFANESREVIKDCLEFRFYINDLELYELKMIEEYKEILNTIKVTSTQIERSLLFLDKNDSENLLEGQHDNVWTRKKNLIRILNELIEHYEDLKVDRDRFEKIELMFNDECLLMRGSLDRIVAYLQPFSIYKLNFNRKKLANSIMKFD